MLVLCQFVPPCVHLCTSIPVVPIALHDMDFVHGACHVPSETAFLVQDEGDKSGICAHASTLYSV